MKRKLLPMIIIFLTGAFSGCELLEVEEKVVLTIDPPVKIEPGKVEFVQVGTQKWMNQNLSRPDDVIGSCYDNMNSYCNLYGRMYTWSEAMQVSSEFNSRELGAVSLPYQGICPEGSHLPSHQEWQTLYTFLQKNPREISKFTNQLGGAYDYKGYFRSEKDEVLFWSSSEYDVRGSSYAFEFAWLWGFHDDDEIANDNAHKITKAYVRCIQDEDGFVKSSSSREQSSSSVEDIESSSSISEVSSSSIEDVDIIQVNSLWWMTKNLNENVEGSRCYKDEPENCVKYGRLYTWAQAMKLDEKYDQEKLGEITLPHQGICPDGFRLPSHKEWKDLELSLDDSISAYFANQLGGAYDYKAYYRSENEEVLFWSSTEYDATGTSYGFEFSWLVAFHKNYTVGFDNAHKITGAYVRCVRE